MKISSLNVQTKQKAETTIRVAVMIIMTIILVILHILLKPKYSKVSVYIRKEPIIIATRQNQIEIYRSNVRKIPKLDHIR